MAFDKYDKARILALHDEGKTTREIIAEIGDSALIPVTIGRIVAERDGPKKVPKDAQTVTPSERARKENVAASPAAPKAATRATLDKAGATRLGDGVFTVGSLFFGKAFALDEAEKEALGGALHEMLRAAPASLRESVASLSAPAVLIGVVATILRRRFASFVGVPGATMAADAPPSPAERMQVVPRRTPMGTTGEAAGGAPTHRTPPPIGIDGFTG